MNEETGLDIKNPQIVGVKRFPTKDGRYVVFLFKATEYSGTVVPPAEDRMVWMGSNHLRMINDPALTEFQYLFEVTIKQIVI